MSWTQIIADLYTVVLFPLILLGGVALIAFLSAKIAESKAKTNNETAKKYLDMLDVTISNAVLATTQTYVESLKKQGKFDAEAQKIAFQQTYDAIMAVLTEESRKYITEAVGDLTTYVTTKIEAKVMRMGRFVRPIFDFFKKL